MASGRSAKTVPRARSGAERVSRAVPRIERFVRGSTVPPGGRLRSASATCGANETLLPRQPPIASFRGSAVADR